MQDVMQFLENHTIISSIWIILFSALIITIFQRYFSKIHVITCSEAIQLINKENVLIIDIRNKDEYQSGHIATSINISVKDIKNGNLGNLYSYKKKPVVVVCSYGNISRNPANDLNKAGFEKVYILKEGISGWIEEHLPLIL